VSNLHRQDPGTDVAGLHPDRDAAQVTRTLRRVGPLHLDELAQEPDLLEWSTGRIERAVTTAWARNMIFVDPRDLLVAL
jgi:hypothetical protein